MNKDKLGGKTFMICDFLIGFGLFAFGLLGILFGGSHDPLLMGAIILISLSFILKGLERKKVEEKDDPLLEEDESEK